MNFKPSLFFLSGILLFCLFHQGNRPFIGRKSSPMLTALPGLPKSQSTGARLWKALITGESRLLKNKETYYRLGIGHIFTPSGLHLSTLRPVFKRLPHVAVVFLILGFLASFLKGMQAMTRVLFIKSSGRFGKRSWGFAVVMILEGIFISWVNHPISWVCSWIFMGFCLFAPKNNRALWFSLGQMLLCFMFFQQWSILGVVINLFSTPLLSLIFPITLILSFLPWSGLHDLMEVLLVYTHESAIKIDQIHWWFPTFYPHLGHLLFFWLWIITHRNYRKLILSPILLILCEPLNITKYKNTNNSKWEIIEVDSLTKCRNNWKNQRWEKVCRPIKNRATNQDFKKL